MLNITLFGSLAVSWQAAESEVEAISLSGRLGCLLAFLALARGHFFPRGELIATLWGDRRESNTLGSFNTTLWRLRKAIEKPPLVAGELIACDRRGAISMSRDARCVLDVEEFEHLVAPALAKPLDRLEATDVQRLRDGVARYTDDILSGFSDDWALRERERQRRHHLNALGRLMQVSTLAGDYGGAIDYAQKILDRDMLREDIHRELMRLLLSNGQRALALRQFERCRDSLRRELAIQPMRETMLLYQQIAAHAVSHDDPDAAAPREGWPTESLRPVPAWSTAHVGFSGNEPSPSPQALIEAARHHLALADAQLLRTLAAVTPASHRPASA
jgi:DNA-binding SARP family transcriptional activator